MKIKHWQGYGTVEAKKIKDNSCTLHIRVSGNHEWGIERNDDYDLFNWLVKRFDKSQDDYRSWWMKEPIIKLKSYIENGVDVCDYYFTY